MATKSALLSVAAGFVAEVQQMLEENHNSEIQMHVYPNMEPETSKIAVMSLLRNSVIKSRCLRVNYNSVTKELALVASCNVFNTLSRWIRFEIRSSFLSETLTLEEIGELEVKCGATLAGFTAPYQDSAKAPDVSIRPKRMEFPTIVIQTGWSEALPMLMADKELWITGAPQTTKLVLLVVWRRLADNKLEVVLLAFRPGKPRETYSIFPATGAGSAAGDILISRNELFGDAIPANSNPHAIFTLSIARLRNVAEGQIRANGYIPVGP